MNPKDFLQTAQQLASATDEASLRTAVGRAYYAAFLVARDKLGLTNMRKQVHLKVEQQLKRQRKFAVAGKLHRLKELRHEADYKLSTAPTVGNWNAAWTRAESLALSILASI